MTNPIKCPRVGVGGFVIDGKGRLLLQLRNKDPEANYWSIAGGAVEYLENVQDALKRELKEELGIEAVVEDLLCVTDHILPEEQAHWVSPAYLVRIIAGEATNLEPHAVKEIAWFSMDTLPEKLTMTAKAAINAYKEMHKTRRLNQI